MKISNSVICKLVQFLQDYFFFFISMQQNSLHIDLRLLNKIKFDKYNLNVRFGSGLIWADVLNVVDPKRYTVIHGSVSFLYPSKLFLTISGFQAKNVGVGGYLLGVGVNPIGTTHRHGYGADNVIEYKVVLADGSIALVNDYQTKIINRNGTR